MENRPKAIQQMHESVRNHMETMYDQDGALAFWESLAQKRKTIVMKNGALTRLNMDLELQGIERWIMSDSTHPLDGNGQAYMARIPRLLAERDAILAKIEARVHKNRPVTT